MKQPSMQLVLLCAKLSRRVCTQVKLVMQSVCFQSRFWLNSSNHSTRKANYFLFTNGAVFWSLLLHFMSLGSDKCA